MSDLVGKKLKVLDDGFVRLVDYFGSDEDVAQAARVSYAKGTKTARDDANLVRYLMRHEHYSPFGQVQIKFHVRLPIFVHNQWVRHDRFCWNVMSARYSIMPSEKWRPDVDEWRAPSSTNKQAGDKALDGVLGDKFDGKQISRAFHGMKHDTPLSHASHIKHDEIYNQAEYAYQALLQAGVCREQARSVLPMGQYTEAFVTANLGDWMLFLRRRMDSHAQKEIQVYAVAIYEILSELFPVSMQAFMDYQHESQSFSRMELAALREILAGNVKIFELSPAERVELLEKHGLTSKRERVEFFQKIK